MTDAIESFSDRLARRLARVGLSLHSRDSDRFERYYRLLEKWNARINLTSLDLLNSPAATLDRLFVEPLLAAEFVVDEPLTWFDLGSGGGSPAIPLKVVRPATRLTMVDSVAKKGVFLREACRAVELPDVLIRTARIEDLPGLLPAELADLLTIRAVRIDSAVLESVGYLLRRGGRLLHFAASAETPTGFRVVDRRGLTAPGDSLMVLERQ